MRCNRRILLLKGYFHMKRIRIVTLGLVSAVLMTSCGALGSVQSETEHTEAEVSETSVAETSVSAETTVTESSVETSETLQEPLVPDEDRLAAYESYRSILENSRDMILAYDWMASEYRSGKVPSENMPCALSDLTGDGLEELIVMQAEGDGYDGMYFSASLDVYSYDTEDGLTSSILHLTGFDFQAAGGQAFYAVKTDDGNLVVYTSGGDEDWVTTYTEYAFDGSYMSEELNLYLWEGPNEDYTENICEYKVNYQTSDEAEYLTQVEALGTHYQSLLLYNEIPDGDAAYSMSSIAMTYDRTYEVLMGALGSSYEAMADADAEAFFADCADEYYMTSGVGGWGAALVVAANGTFEYNYHDSDYGAYYICHANGVLGNVRKVDDNTYMVDVLDIVLEYEPDTTWTETDMDLDMTIQYNAVEPYGINSGDTLMFYCAGSMSESLPSAYVEWYCMPRAISPDESPAQIPLDGFFNVSDECSFFEEEYD